MANIPGFSNNLLNAAATNATGTAVPIQDRAPKNLYIVGPTFGGGTVTIQFSTDNTNWSTLNDPAGTAIAKTAPFQCGFIAGLYGAYYRAVFAGSSGTTNVSVALV